MPTQFITLTNRLLRRVNEVTISQTDFASVRGVQNMAKDAIVATIYDINKRETEWPFNAVVCNVPLQEGVQDYNFPDTLTTVKWNTFALRKDDTLGTNSKNLRFVSRDYWDEYYKERDYNGAKDSPELVFPKHGTGFSLSPVPDKAYPLSYEYFINSPTLVNHDDVSTIPSIYDEVIIQGAIYHFYMFRSNEQQASMAEDRYKKEFEFMRIALLGRDDTMRSTLTVRSTGPSVLAGYMY